MDIKGIPVTIPNYQSYIYSYILDEEEINKNIIEQIEWHGDMQDKSTNVKSLMTPWLMMQKSGFKELNKIVLQIMGIISKEYYKHDLPHYFKTFNMWGVKYEHAEDFTVPHDHWPAIFSFVYYINPPPKCPPLYFRECNLSIQPQHGQLIFFDGRLIHEVKQQGNEDVRYVVAGNIGYVHGE